MPLSASIKDEICRLYTTGMSIKAISGMIEVSQPTISRILKSRGVAVRKSNYQTIKLDTLEINKLYEEGLSTYSLAKMFDVSSETIRKHITNTRPSSSGHNGDTKLKISRASLANWQQVEYRTKVAEAKTAEYRQSLSTSAQKNYHKSLGEWISDPANRRAIAEATKELWADPEYRRKQEVYFQERGTRLTAASNMALTDPEKRAAWIDKIRRNNADRINGGWISTTQKQFYYLLDQADITYYPEGDLTRISPFYVVDCIIPVQQRMSKPLIVEINGEYWHSLPHVKLKDRQKATYIENNTEYDLIVIEELEMHNFPMVQGKLAEYGLTLSDIECSVSDLVIEQITEEQAKEFYSTFHYSATVRKGAITYGAFYNQQLVGVISYTFPLRRTTATRLGYELKEVMEISRMARRTNLICNNFLSWFISKTMRKLPKSAKCIVSFSDSTYGHTGGVYKAANFKNDGEISPDYTYLSTSGQYHKKTIWDRAKRMKMTENDYAIKHGLIKTYGGPKTRWIFTR